MVYLHWCCPEDGLTSSVTLWLSSPHKEATVLLSSFNWGHHRHQLNGPPSNNFNKWPAKQRCTEKCLSFVLIRGLISFGMPYFIPSWLLLLSHAQHCQRWCRNGPFLDLEFGSGQAVSRISEDIFSSRDMMATEDIGCTTGKWNEIQK